MAESNSAISGNGFGATMRRDAWWIELIPVVLILGAFTVYATWRTFENDYYEFGPYLSPFYSPLMRPRWWPLSPAILILWAPLVNHIHIATAAKLASRSYSKICIVISSTSQSFSYSSFGTTQLLRSGLI